MFSLPYILVTDRGLGDCCGFEGFAPASFGGNFEPKTLRLARALTMWIWAQPRHMAYGWHFFKRMSQVTCATWMKFSEAKNVMVCNCPAYWPQKNRSQTSWGGSHSNVGLNEFLEPLRYSSDAVAHLVFTLILILGLKRIDMYNIDVDVQKVLSISILIYYILDICTAGFRRLEWFLRFFPTIFGSPKILGPANFGKSTTWGISPAHWFPKCVSGLSALIRLGEEGLSTVADLLDDRGWIILPSYVGITINHHKDSC